MAWVFAHRLHTCLSIRQTLDEARVKRLRDLVVGGSPLDFPGFISRSDFGGRLTLAKEAFTR